MADDLGHVCDDADRKMKSLVNLEKQKDRSVLCSHSHSKQRFALAVTRAKDALVSGCELSPPGLLSDLRSGNNGGRRSTRLARQEPS